ncbi:MAG: 23S rRNA (adenine(2503)-C(2))-methyltransferase RlmN [Holophagales bacterium]|jgi:23S rRNA (adenine2503-C2)-methyltransferase|nr:23S rRNA (adenine(2503)-C(2))-methyltransferase RlmN [Holophagales bacterium]
MESLLPLSSGNAAGMSLGELNSLCQRLGEAKYRAAQIFEGMYRHRWRDWNQFSNLSKDLRGRLASEARVEWLAIEQSVVSSDASVKHTLKLADGCETECVYMPYENRATLCISSQVGCAMACSFCATGAMGIKRNLTAAEMVGQVMSLVIHHKHPNGTPINIVFMGMGEPLHNLGHVMDAFFTLSHPKGMAVPPWRVTVSTSGLVPGIARLGEYNPRPRLALSLNATSDDVRSKIMPVNSVWGLEKLALALRSFPLGPDELITLEYVLIAGYSDSAEDAERLSRFAGRFPSKINLIPYNSWPGSAFSSPDEADLNRMGRYLAERGHIVSIRRSRGQDIGGACGQLAFHNRSERAI